jgi:dimethylargininase
MPIAVTRPVSRSLAACQLTHVARNPIDAGLAADQHADYEAALVGCGCRVHRLEPAHDLADAVFVEDAAVVLDEVAVITRPGAVSRRAEVSSVAEALAVWRSVVRIQEPGTIDGGDVLRLGRRLWVGRSSRTNAAGFEQLRAFAEPLGYRVVPIEVAGCLHLKSAVTAVDAETLLVNPAWLPSGAFDDCRLLDIDDREQHAANALPVGGRVIYPAAYPRTADRLREHGADLEIVDVSELAKAEGAVTCCCILI